MAAERNRLARELHDAVTQTIFSASFLAGALPSSWENDREEGKNVLLELQKLNQGALAEVRTLLLDLRPVGLIEARMIDLLNQLAMAATGREGIPIGVVMEGECDLSPEVHVAFYRIAQEALNNVVKHSRASWAEIKMCCEKHPGKEGKWCGREELLVSDNGCGFDLDSVSSDHMGLGIMHERAQSVGAKLTIESKSGSGSMVSAVWKREEDG